PTQIFSLQRLRVACNRYSCAFSVACHSGCKQRGTLQAGFTLRQAIDIKGYTLGDALLQTNQFGQSSGKINPLDRAPAVKVFQYPRHPENNGFLQQDCNTALRKISDRLGKSDAHITSEIWCAQAAGLCQAKNIVHCQISEPALSNRIGGERSSNGVERAFDGEMGMLCTVLIHQSLQITIRPSLLFRQIAHDETAGTAIGQSFRWVYANAGDERVLLVANTGLQDQAVVQLQIQSCGSVDLGQD